MSLNGLDDASIKEAYETSVAEPGGWFLLKYTSRDEVELLSRGTGGVSEVREAVAKYTEPSPLYGFIKYRRRSVLVKYVPEGISRLLQARLTVHFQSIIDSFTPHDTIFTIASADDLKDSALSAACSLHAASVSASSSTSSVQRQRLVEIAEDEEEGSTIRARSENATPTEATHPPTAQDGNPERLNGASKALKSLEEKNTEIRPEDRPLPASPTKGSLDLETRSMHEGGKFSQQSSPIQGEGRLSTSSLRPSTRDMHDMYPYGFKPKIKLGPRPSVDPGKRPQTAGSTLGQSNVRPVSSLPPGIRLAPRKNATDRPRSQHSNPPANGITAPPPVPQSLPLQPPTRPTTSPGKIPLSGPGGHASKSKSTTTLLEKQRLMKAMQLRKKQMSNPGGTQLNGVENLETPTPHQSTQDEEDVSPGIEAEDESNEDPTPHDDQSGEDARLPDEKIEGQDMKIPNVSSSSPVSVTASSELPSTKESSISEATEIAPVELEEKEKETEDDNDSVEKEPDLVSTRSSEHKPILEEPGEDDEVSSILSAKPFESEKGEEENAITSNEEDTVPRVMAGPPSSDVNGITTDKEPQTQEVPEQVTHSSQGQSLPTHIEPSDEISAIKDEDNPNNSTATIPPANDKELVNLDQSRLNHRKRRSKTVEPIKTDIADTSDDNILSDDSLMDELDTATVQEAQPVSVAKSPLTPISPGNTSEDMPLGDSPRSQRSTSNPTNLKVEPLNHRFSTEVPVIETARSVSASRLNTMRAQQTPVAIAKKVNVSTGISQRIKALEMRSSSNTPPLSSAPSPNGSPSFPNIRNTTLRAPPSRSASNASHRSPVGKLTPSPSPSSSPEQLVPSKRTERLNNNQENLKPTPKAGSISVTARIIRDPNAAMRDGVDGDPEASPLGLFQSPIIIEHQDPATQTVKLAAIPPNERPISAVLPASPSADSTPSANKANRTSASTSSRRSSTDRRRSDTKTPKSPRSPPASSGSFPNGISEDVKKESTKDRLLRRMSSISSQSRKSLAQAISPTVKEEDQNLGETPQSTLQSLSTNKNSSQVIGEVNVQFPDNLLWKRRCLNLDGQGNIILTQSKADENTKVASRRFHLSEFLPPFAPDHDRQELPYSVVLDHLDGGTLQCACENVSGQNIILTALRQAHRAVHAPA